MKKAPDVTKDTGRLSPSSSSTPTEGVGKIVHGITIRLYLIFNTKQKI